MIIGNNSNNNFNNSNTFNQRMKDIQNNSKKLTKPYYHGDPNKSTNILNKNEMREKSFSMLEERLRNGSISIEEYNKQCQKLNNIK